MGETGSTDLAPVGSLATITDDKDTHLTLGGLDGGVSLAGWHGVTLAVEQEVVDESLHVLLHGSTWGRSNLVVLNLDGAGGDLVQALVDDAEGLSELLHAAEVAVIAVTVLADGNVKLDLVVGIVWLGLSDVPWNTGTAEHDTGEGVVEGISGGDDTDTLGPANPDTVVCEKLLSLIDTVAELGGPLVNIIEETDGKILGDTTGADVGSMETSSRDTLVELL